MPDTADRPSPHPDVPAEIREAARMAPDHWFGLVDPAWRGRGTPPAWAVMGEWRAGVEGEIEEWRDNAEYRPSPAALGWPGPTDSVDEALQLAATGYGPVEDMVRLLATAQVRILLTPDDVPLSTRTVDDLPVVPVFTSDAYVRTLNGLLSRTLPMADVMARVPEPHGIYVNPTGPVGMVVGAEPLNAAIAAARAHAPL